MAMTNAEKQQAWRDRRNALLKELKLTNAKLHARIGNLDALIAEFGKADPEGLRAARAAKARAEAEAKLLRAKRAAEQAEADRIRAQGFYGRRPTTLSIEDKAKLAKILEMLRSDQDGEVINAARLAVKFLEERRVLRWDQLL
jgi:hypothetical protein